jgi:predicted  nucleic acid-binding Zn-ribbon protein
MSADTGLARFDTRQGRAAQAEESSEQTDFRTIGAREQGQLALDELETVDRDDRTSVDTQAAAAEESTREDLEAALGCARATIDGLREQVAQLEAERDQLREELEDER